MLVLVVSILLTSLIPLSPPKPLLSTVLYRWKVAQRTTARSLISLHVTPPNLLVLTLIDPMMDMQRLLMLDVLYVPTTNLSSTDQDLVFGEMKGLFGT